MTILSSYASQVGLDTATSDTTILSFMTEISVQTVIMNISNKTLEPYHLGPFQQFESCNPRPS